MDESLVVDKEALMGELVLLLPACLCFAYICNDVAVSRDLERIGGMPGNSSGRDWMNMNRALVVPEEARSTFASRETR